ncbi:hypothetical protein BDZ91DRAFT_723060 [Kalaharituber pfeilii]|nr:hypothetical protein BDZ91DRAFT_723060 [Kalaharituber pfeilii]
MKLRATLVGLPRRPGSMRGVGFSCAASVRMPAPLLFQNTLRFSSSSSTSSSTSHSTTNPRTNPSKPPPRPAPYYSFFPRTLPSGPPPSGPFTISPRLLRQEYLTLQQRLHPDLLHSHHYVSSHPHPPHPRPPASPLPHPELTSSTLSKAYSTLLDPLLRAEYILHTQSPHPHHRDIEAAPSIDSPQLLSEVLELREAIEEAAGNIDLINKMLEENQIRCQNEEEYVGKLLEEGRWEEAWEGLGRWRYWRSMDGRLKQLEEDTMVAR